MSEMKTREDYLIEFENKLLSLLKEIYLAVNKNVSINYALAALVFLLGGGTITEFSFLGAKFNLNIQNFLTFIPFMMSIMYSMTGYNFLKIASIFRQINKTSEEIIQINAQAKPVMIRDMNLFSFGLVGLILSLSRWQARRLLKSERLDIDRELSIFLKRLSIPNNLFPALVTLLSAFIRVTNWIVNVALRFLVLVAIFMIPSLAVLTYIYIEFFYQKFSWFSLPVLSFITLFLSTIIMCFFGFILFSAYVIDIIDSFKGELKSVVSRIEKLGIFQMIETIIKIWNSFL